MGLSTSTLEYRKLLVEQSCFFMIHHGLRRAHKSKHARKFKRIAKSSETRKEKSCVAKVFGSTKDPALCSKQIESLKSVTHVHVENRSRLSPP